MIPLICGFRKLDTERQYNNMNELIQIIKILEQDEVQELNKFIDTLTFSPCPIFNDKSEILSAGRTSTGLVLDDEVDITKKLHVKMNEGLDEYRRRVGKIHDIFSYYPIPGGVGTRSWRERIQILQYEKTQEYGFHHDAADNREMEQYHRQISVITYLTDGFDGGGTAFTHATLKPKPGYALIFPSNWTFPHAGEPVMRGCKRVAVTWYYAVQA